MTNPSRAESIADWKCERYLLGELDPQELEQIRAMAEADAELRERLHRLRKSNEDILGHYPPAQMARQIEAKLSSTTARAASEQRGYSRPRVWVPAAVAALVVGLLILHPSLFSELGFLGLGGSEEPGIRLKGNASELSLHRRTPTGSERLAEGAVAFPHDRIGIRYSSQGGSYGFIASIDGRGVLTRHLPLQGERASRLEAGEHGLDSSYELDDAPRWEIFLLVSSKRPFELDAVIAPIESSELVLHPNLSAAAADSTLRALPLPRDLILSTHILLKEAGDEG